MISDPLGLDIITIDRKMNEATIHFGMCVDLTTHQEWDNGSK
jgi:hypothetical protein